jgi:flavorubredoxin
MHGSTKKMVLFLIDELIDRKIKVFPFNLSKTDIGELAMAMVYAATIILASPTVLTGPHPSILYVAYLTNILRPKLKYAGIIGSFGWGSKIEEKIIQLLSNLNVDLLPSVLINGYPREKDYLKLSQLAEKISFYHHQITI